MVQRSYAGTIASGIVRVGDEVTVLPSLRTSRVTKILGPSGDLDEAFAPMAVAVSLEDELDVGRGDVLAHPGNLPSLSRDVEAMLVWMDEKPLETGRPYQLRIGTSVSGASVSELRYAIDVTTLKRVPAGSLGPNEIGRASLVADAHRAARPLRQEPLDGRTSSSRTPPTTGSWPREWSSRPGPPRARPGRPGRGAPRSSCPPRGNASSASGR